MQARFHAALWEAVRSLFPEGAEAFGGHRHGLSIRWPADERRRTLRPHARPVMLFASEHLARALDSGFMTYSFHV